MQLLYNSESYAVVQFEVPATTGQAQPPVQQAMGADLAAAQAVAGVVGAPGTAATAGTPADTLTGSGIEIVDKFARREVFIQGALAERFIEGVKMLAATQPTEDQFDDYIADFAGAAQQPVVLH